jgi:hypothetical protein
MAETRQNYLQPIRVRDSDLNNLVTHLSSANIIGVKNNIPKNKSTIKNAESTKHTFNVGREDQEKFNSSG